MSLNQVKFVKQPTFKKSDAKWTFDAQDGSRFVLIRESKWRNSNPGRGAGRSTQQFTLSHYRGQAHIETFTSYTNHKVTSVASAKALIVLKVQA
jgi:hypothetical protein